MTSASLVAALVADLESIAAAQPATWPWVARLRQAGPGFATRAPLLLAAAQAARHGVYRTIALLLTLRSSWRPDFVGRVCLRALGEARQAR